MGRIIHMNPYIMEKKVETTNQMYNPVLPGHRDLHGRAHSTAQGDPRSEQRGVAGGWRDPLSNWVWVYMVTHGY